MKTYLRFIPMVCIMGMIFYLSHQPGDFAGLPQLPGIDKFAHVFAYGCLAASFLYALHPFANTVENNFVTAVTVVLFCLLFGISDEFHQSFIQGRFVSFWDVMADGFGAKLVVSCWYKNIKGKSLKESS